MMKPSPTLISRLAPLLQPSAAAYPPVIMHTTSVAAVLHPVQQVECGYPTSTSHPHRDTHLPGLLADPVPAPLQTQQPLRRTQAPAPGESHVPPPTIAWCDYLSMV